VQDSRFVRTTWGTVSKQGMRESGYRVMVLRRAVATKRCSIIKSIAAHGISQQLISNGELNARLDCLLSREANDDLRSIATRILVTLLEAGVSPNRVLPDKGPLLWVAIKNRYCEVIPILIEWKADVKSHGDWASLSLLLFQSRMDVYDRANRFNGEEARLADR
jgi:hypothetical protein